MAVTITRGKTHTRFARLLLDGINASGDARSLQNAGEAYNQSEASGWNDGIENYLHGLKMLNFGMFRAIFNSRAAATGPVEPGSYETLGGIDIDFATLVLGIGEAPTIGAPAFSADVLQFSAPLTVAAADPLIIEGDFSGPVDGRSGWGKALSVGTSYSSSTDLGSIDNGASSSDGYLAYLHVTQSAGAMGSNNWSLVIEHSTDDSAWSTLDTFTLDGSAVGAEKVSGAGTVNRYVRLALTKTAGTDIIPWVNFIRL